MNGNKYYFIQDILSTKINSEFLQRFVTDKIPVESTIERSSIKWKKFSQRRLMINWVLTTAILWRINNTLKLAQDNHRIHSRLLKISPNYRCVELHIRAVLLRPRVWENNCNAEKRGKDGKLYLRYVYSTDKYLLARTIIIFH